MKKPELAVIAVALLAAAAKLYCAWTTIGTSDVVNFLEFGRVISQRGLLAMYRETPWFNHTPIVGTFVASLFDWTGGHGRPFAHWLRVPGILADFISVLVLLWIRRRIGRPDWWALTLFAASPVAFMISGYHGNLDSVLALGILLAVAACVAGNAALCGLAIGLSCQIKIVPVLLAPIFFFFWLHRSRRGAVQFSIVVAFTLLVGWYQPLLAIPGTFLKNVLGYSSILGVWGVTYLLRLADMPGFQNLAFTNLTPAQGTVVTILKYVAIAAVLFVAWQRRDRESSEVFGSLAFAWAVLFTFAPGFGSQYLIWPAAAFLICSERWFVALTAASSISLFVFYNVVSNGMPWNAAPVIHALAARWAPWFLLPWAVFIAFLAIKAKPMLFAKDPTGSETRTTSG